MIYVFFFLHVDIPLEGITPIYLNSDKPLRQIYDELYKMKNDDIVIMLPEDLAPYPNYLIKIIRIK